MAIHQLSETVINQIAAGEVIERPASVVKELVENALDAGARKVIIVTAGGGLSLIRVTDDGSGIPEQELVLAVSRHCTSKLSEDLLDIRSLGFRGEALPSIGSVSHLSVKSRTAASDSGMEVSVDGGKLSGPRPSPCQKGTQVEVRDLFFNTPARLKFMKGERAEASAITDVIRSANGRAASAASWARRSFAAATICIALVILRVFFTLPMRFFKSLRLGIDYLPCPALRRSLSQKRQVLHAWLSPDRPKLSGLSW